MRVSVIATVRNEEASIDSFLRSLLGQSRAPDEIVVVDGGSTDGTVEAIRSRANGHTLLRVHTAPGSTIAQGRNIAIQHAEGEIVAVADAGTTLASNWLELLVEPLEHDPEIAVSSGYFLPGGEHAFERRLAAIITPHRAEIHQARFLPSSRSIAFRREWWEAVGGYPEWLRHCEDLVFDMAMRDAGARFRFTPDAIVTWRARPSLRRFFTQYMDYARGDGHALLFPRRHAIRYGSYGAGIALALAGRSRPWTLGVLAAAASLYLSKYCVRVARYSRLLGRRDSMAAAALVPVVVVTGDVAKMVGYPVGRWQRLRAGGPDGLEALLRRRSLNGNHGG